MEKEMEAKKSGARKVKWLAHTLSKDLFPRYLSRAIRPIIIASKFGEYRKRISIARDNGAKAGKSTADLRNQGYHIIDEQLAGMRELCERASVRLQNALEFPSKGNKAFFAQLLKSEDRKPGSPFLQVALNNRILSTVATYLGGAPYLEFIDLLYSRPVSGLSSSQLWHKDRTDRKLVKLVVYCQDVGEENGPFSFFDASDSRRVPALVPHYLSDDRIANYVPLEKQVQITGSAGSALLIDTSRCFHYGSRCAKPRLAIFAYYSTGFGYKPRETTWEECFESASGLSPLQKAAIGLI